MILIEKTTRPPVLLEQWLPVDIIGAESLRDASAAQKPPHSRLHVWWARRPLSLSRAAILGSLLPPDTDREWFLQALGIFGDPVKTRKELEEARKTGENLGPNPYGYARAFTYTPLPDKAREIIHRIQVHWETHEVRLLDSMAGGGSIPFEALRYGLTTYVGELNPVACVILKATLDYPFRFGPELTTRIRKWGHEWVTRVRQDLTPYFPKRKGEQIFAYVWARTVRCPECDLIVPLSPNWWLDRSGDPPTGTAVRLNVPERGKGDTCTFDIVEVVRGSLYDPGAGTKSGNGPGRCPRCNESLPGNLLKREAQAGRMEQQLYALVVRTIKGKSFCLPDEEDVRAFDAAVHALKEQWGEFKAEGLIPTDLILPGEKTNEARRYGFLHFCDFFSSRQLLSLLTYLKHLREIQKEITADHSHEEAMAISTYLALALDKAADYNTRLVRWDSTRNKIANTFDRHDFSFKWSHGEFDSADMLLPWVLDQVCGAYREAAELAKGASGLGTIWHRAESKGSSPSVNFSKGSAADLYHIDSESIDIVCVDPPYYDNVMYAELADFFYVWLKRSVGHLYPDWFTEELTDKDQEAVANKSRFTKRGTDTPKSQAERDYENKMRACFGEMHRVLKPHGVLTVMFTHKRVEAWDTLASALINAGFEIEASWPVHTESEHSLHQAKKNAAESTILLVCRKRIEGKGGTVWWEELAPEVARVAREKAEEFQALGIRGVDLYLSTFGPALSVLSKHWPVKDRSGSLIRPDVALDEARRAVTEWRFERILHGRKARFDPATEFVILAWDVFRAVQFRADEGRRLAISVGVELDKELMKRKVLVDTPSGSGGSRFLALQTPAQRQRKKPSQVDVEAESFESTIDAVHAAMRVYERDGSATLARWIEARGFAGDELFVAALEALLTSIPPKREEFQTLKSMVLAVRELQDRIDLKQLSLAFQEDGLDEGDAAETEGVEEGEEEESDA